jgi:cytosine/creatinine deaminase
MPCKKVALLPQEQLANSATKSSRNFWRCKDIFSNVLTTSADRYWLTNAHVPVSLLSAPLSESLSVVPTREGLAAIDIEISDRQIITVQPSGSGISDLVPQINLHHGIVLPCFIDMHTHLDKGQIWNRNPNLDGTFAGALQAVEKDRDRDRNWSYEDIYRRMEFGLKCSYAHGTKAIRTHIDCPPDQAGISLAAFKDLSDQWSDRITLQAVSLITLDGFSGKQGEQLADQIAELGGTLGGVAYVNPNLKEQLDRVFNLAKERELDLDFHVDETDDPTSDCLRQVAEAAIHHQFAGRVVCGHCCSLAVQPPEVAAKTIQLVKLAKIGIVSLPMCNLYLQDRYDSQTPHWRGVTLLHELKAAGVPVAIASDNCRDPFYGFGDHDGLEVFNMAVRIAHLDTPYGDWVRAITTTPANLMGLHNSGRIGVGLPADLILFKARYFSELLSRPQSDRTVLRHGKAIDTSLPDYRELDDLVTR